MVQQAAIRIVEPSQVGEARRTAVRYAELARMGENDQGKVAIIATELANNLVRHARDGLMLIQLVQGELQPTVEIISLDRGPGIQNIDECLRDGYSTAGTAGNGLGAVKRMSTEFDIFSEPERGTAILSRVTAGGVKPYSNLQMGAVSIAMTGEVVCGDCWCSSQTPDGFRVMVGDGLGHGPLAAEAANALDQVFATSSGTAPKQFLETAHRCLSGTRGAAVSIAYLDPSLRRLVYSGIGNISGSLHSPFKTQGLVSHNGIIGVRILKIQEFEYSCEDSELLIMHSDGLKTRWSLKDHPGLQKHHPATVAGILYRDYCRDKDDVTVVVARFDTKKEVNRNE